MENIDRLRKNTTLGCHSRPIRERHSLLGGNLGILDLFNRVIASINTAEIDPKQLDYSVDFIITRNVEAGARFLLLPWGGRKTGTLGVSWSGKDIQTHRLSIVLTPPPKPEKCRLKFIDEKDKQKFRGVCPEEIVSIGPDGVTSVDPKLLSEYPFLKTVPKVEPKPGAREFLLDQEETRRSQRALDRSALQGIVEELRGRDIGQ